jgi:hypothetical protein
MFEFKIQIFYEFKIVQILKIFKFRKCLYLKIFEFGITEKKKEKWKKAVKTQPEKQ